MTLETRSEHMIAEANALETSKKIYGITDHTDRPTFNADAQYRKLRLEVHPDKSRAFCVRHNIPQLHEVVNPFFTQAAAALPMVHRIVKLWVNGESLTPPVPAPPASKSDGDTPMSEEEDLSCSQPGGQAHEEGFYSYLIDLPSDRPPVSVFDYVGQDVVGLLGELLSVDRWKDLREEHVQKALKFVASLHGKLEFEDEHERRYVCD